MPAWPADEDRAMGVPYDALCNPAQEHARGAGLPLAPDDNQIRQPLFGELQNHCLRLTIINDEFELLRLTTCNFRDSRGCRIGDVLRRERQFQRGDPADVREEQLAPKLI